MSFHKHKISCRFFAGLIIAIGAVGCAKEINLDSIAIDHDKITENVFVVVIDGPRYSETWGDPNHELIPNLSQTLSKVGVINREFYNQGTTHTLPGHTAIISGVYEDLDNNGKQYPTYPSYLQHWLYHSRSNPNQAWVVGSKKKLKVLANCSSLEWRNSYLPSVDVENRLDKNTFSRVKEIIAEHHPKMMFINLKGPDYWGHGGNWEAYRYGIFQTDSMLNALYNIVENDTVYAGKTTIIMSNDHGRHLEGIQNGYINHGDRCIGCTHINFFAFGPDFKSNVITAQQREQVDIAPTVARLMGYEMLQVEGEIMNELFKD